jgi:23S rRNA pseudouridine2604 synthase
MELVRLNKYLKDTGICSRRKADEFIVNGHIKVNGIVVTELGYKINPQIDKVEVLTSAHQIISQFKYIVLNKPKGYVCSKSDLDGKTIFELVPDIKDLTYAGRLDKDSQGLIILSNDGQFIYNIAGAEFHCEKEYLVRVNKIITPEYLKEQSNGNIKLNGKTVRKTKIEYINDYLYKIILTEGMNRQIRRMAENQGYKVTGLKRIRIGIISDHNISIGTWRYLNQNEIESLKRTI